MRALITGGAGFIGSHLATRLIDEGHEVRVLDDFSTGSMSNIEPLLESSSFRFEKGSVTDKEVVASLVDGVDVVFHLAAAVGVRLIVTSPTHTIRTNVRGCEVVLDAAARNGTLTVVASTSEVYGKSTKLPFAEGDDLVFGATTKPRWGYACSKAIDEYLALAYAREQQLPVIVARFFNTVGPRQTGEYGMVLPTFVGQGLRGDDITVHGDGEQCRCFCHVADVVEALLRLVATSASHGEVINIGADQEISINDLAERVVAATGGGSRLVHVPYDEAYDADFEDLARRVPDLTKLECTIGFRPRTEIDAIIQDVVDHARAASG